MPTGLTFVTGTGVVDNGSYSNVTVSGNDVIFKGIPNYQGLKCFEIQVKLTCDGTNGGPKIKEFLSTFKLNFKCDKDNNNCCNILAGKYDFRIFGNMATCPNIASPNCIQTTIFTVKRNTFGTDPVTGTAVNAGTSGIALDRAYPCDDLLVTSKGKWLSNNTNLLASKAYLNVEFEQATNLIQFVSGTIEIVDNNGVVVKSCSVSPSISSSGIRVTHKFTVPTPCDSYTLLPNYGINLNAIYKVQDDPTIGHGPILSVFRGTFGYTDANGTNITCDGKGDQMTLIRPLHTFKLTTSSTQAKPQCEPVKAVLTWTTETCFEDDFPNEIRNTHQLSGYKLTYPVGYNLLDAKYINVDCKGTTSKDIKTASEVDCTNPYTKTTAFVMEEKCSNSMQQRLEFNLQPTCLVPENGTVSMDVNYLTLPGTACAKTETKTIATPLINYQPKLKVVALPSNVSPTNDLACWTIRVSNASFDIPASQVFLKFPTCTGIKITDVTDIGADQGLNVIGGQCSLGYFGGKQEKLYQICGSYKCPGSACPVEVSWTCGAPYNCESTTQPKVCTADQTTISVTPKEGLLQSEFIAPTDIVDVCKDVKICYTLTNAGEGDLYNVNTKITGFPSCWTLLPDSTCIQAPGTGLVCNSLFNPINGFTFTSLPGSVNGVNSAVKVCFKVKTDCALLNCNPANIVLQTSAKKGCKDVITNTFTSKKLAFNSRPDYYYTPVIVAEPFTYCTDTDIPANGSDPAKNGISTITFNVTVNGPYPNTAGDLVDINIPTGFQYMASSFKQINTVGNITLIGTTGACPNAQVLNLKINNAVLATQVIQFSVDVKRCNAMDAICGPSQFSCDITRNDTRTCTSPVLNCAIGDGKKTDKFLFNVDVQKPSFEVTNIKETSPLGLCSANGQITFTLNNKNGLVLSASDQVPIEIYCSTGCPSLTCNGSPLPPVPQGVTLIKTITVQPGSNLSVPVTVNNLAICNPGTHLFFRVGATCSPTVCFCPTTTCYQLDRPTVDFNVANVCVGANLVIANNSYSVGQQATYTITIKSGNTNLYSSSTVCTTANCNVTLTSNDVNLVPGTYTCEMVLSTVCGSISKIKSFTVYSLPGVTVTPSSVAICPGAQGTILTASGATTYTWSPTAGLSPSSGYQVNANPATTTIYTVTGIDANGCKAIATSKVTVNPVPTVAYGNVELCKSDDCFAFTYLAAGISGGTPYTKTVGSWPNTKTITYYQYNIAGPNGFSFSCSTLSPTYGGSAACMTPLICGVGTYTVTAWGPNLCKGTGTFTVSALNMPTLVGSNKQTCPGTCENVAPLIGYDPINLQSGESITVVNNTTGNTDLSCTQAGCYFKLCPTQTTTYTATFKKVSAKGTTCTRVATFTISMTLDPKVITTCSTPACNGAATVTVASGTPPYTYLWSNGKTTANVNSLCAGNYTVKVTDATGCSATIPVVINATSSQTTITGITNFNNLKTTGLINVGSMAGWTNATLYITNSQDSLSACGNMNNPGYTAPFTSSNVDASGNINVNTLLPSFNKNYNGYTYVWITYTSGCSYLTQSKCIFSSSCTTICGTLSSNAVPISPGLITTVPPVTICVGTSLIIDWTCNQFLGQITLYITEIYDPALGKSAVEVPTTAKSNDYSSYTALINKDLRTLYPFKTGHWYKIEVRGGAPTCNEDGVARLFMFARIMDCTHCSGNFSVSFTGPPANICGADIPVTYPLVGTVNAGGTQPFIYEWSATPTPLLPYQTVVFAAPTPNVSTSSASYQGDGASFVTLWVTDAFGCVATSMREIRSVKAHCRPSGIQEEENASSLQIVPNPTNGSFVIFTDSENEKNVFIYDMTGKLVFEKTKTKEQSLNIDISHLSRGIYLVKVIDGTNYQMKKVVLQ